MNLEDRLAKRITKSASGCWEWTGGKNNWGYGYFYVRGNMVAAHKFLWERQHGAIPNGFELDHLCRNRSCCNPNHLELVTHKENIRRGRIFLRKSTINADEVNGLLGFGA